MIPYAVQLAMAQSVNDKDTVNRVVEECFGGIARELMGIAQKYDYADLPFVLASMMLTAQSMTPLLSEDGQQLVRKLMSHITCVTVDADELRRQTENKEEKDT
jgi:hypothetical protein